jgi:death on curing protein
VIRPSSKHAKSDSEQSEPRWVSRVIANAMHAEILRTLGGLHGIRDKGLVESALDRPRNRFTHAPTADLADLAAAYGFGLTKNHGYVDGKERTAFQVMFVFLDLNDFTLVVSDEAEVVRIMLGVADGAISEPELATWIRGVAQPKNPTARLTPATRR